MRIFIDIGHPAHVHYFKNFMWKTQENGHAIFISARDKEVTFNLLDHYGFKYYNRGKGRKGLLGKSLYIIYADLLLIWEAYRFKPDVFLSFTSTYAAHAAWVLNRPHIAFNDSDHSFFENFTSMPRIGYVLTPKVFQGEYGKRHIRFDGFMELTSLHPKWFKPKPDALLNISSITNNKRFIILRFVSWNATHDIGLKRLSLQDKYYLVQELSKHATVIISSEEKLPNDLMQYAFNVHPAMMHDVLNSACLLVSESLTMAAEAAFLGTPSICISTAEAGTLDEEVRLGLIELYRTNNGLLERAIALTIDESYKEKFKLKSKEIIQTKIDVTSFMIWYVNNFPKSFEIMKNDPDYQYKFQSYKENIINMKLNTDYVINDSPSRENWSDFVHKHPFGNIFQTPQMFDIYRSTPNNNAGVLALENKEKEILAIIVYTLISESGIKARFSTRAIIYGGPLSLDNNISYATFLLAEYKKKINKTKVIYTEIRNLYDQKELAPAFNNEKFIYEDHLTIHMDLKKSVEQLENALHRGRASNIKRAIKKGVTTRYITSKEEITAAYILIKDTYERIHLPAPHPELFLNAAENLKDHIKFFAAFLDDKLIGCRVYLIYKDMIYDWYAAGDRDFSGYHPSDLLPWRGMLLAKENNISIYDFAGAGRSGKEYSVRDYKLKFGGTLIELGRYHYIHKPMLFLLGAFGVTFYKYIG